RRPRGSHRGSRGGTRSGPTGGCRSPWAKGPCHSTSWSGGSTRATGCSRPRNWSRGSRRTARRPGKAAPNGQRQQAPRGNPRPGEDMASLVFHGGTAVLEDRLLPAARVEVDGTRITAVRPDSAAGGDDRRGIALSDGYLPPA